MARQRVRWRVWPFVTVVIVVMISVALGVTVVVLGWPDIGKDQWEDRLDIVQDVGILVAAVFALIFAGWRGWSADRQAGAAQDRADTAQKVLLNDRYQKGAEMLGDSVLAVRLGGIHALAILARESPSDYHIQIMRLFCAFARRPPTGTNTGPTDADQAQGSGVRGRPRQDVQAVIWEIGDRSYEQRQLEGDTEERFDLDLRGLELMDGSAVGVDLSGADLRGSQLSRADFADAVLSSVRIQDSMLDYVVLTGANLFDARLWNADMRVANLRGANLWGAQLLNVNLASADLRTAELWRTDLSSSDLTHVDGDHRKCPESITESAQSGGGVLG